VKLFSISFRKRNFFVVEPYCLIAVIVSKKILTWHQWPTIQVRLNSNLCPDALVPGFSFIFINSKKNTTMHEVVTYAVLNYC